MLCNGMMKKKNKQKDKKINKMLTASISVTFIIIIVLIFLIILLKKEDGKKLKVYIDGAQNKEILSMLDFEQDANGNVNILLPIKDISQYLGYKAYNGEYIYPQYDSIGIDTTNFENDEISNQYILFDNCIPVKQITDTKVDKWTIYDKDGKKYYKYNI